MRKSEVFRRDYWECQKCGRQALEKNFQRSGLVIHHINPRNPVDGGTDAPENLITLCSACHHEWHALEMVSTLPFTQWLKLPTLQLLTSFMLLMLPEQFSIHEAQSLLFNTHAICKEKRRELNNEDGFQNWARQSHDGVMAVWRAGGNLFFVESIPNRTRDVLRDMRGRNLKYSHVPYGFRAVPNPLASGKQRYDLVPDEAQQVVIREILGMRRSGMGYATIARKLNRAGHPSPFSRVRYKGKLPSGEWRHGSVKSVLRTSGFED